MPAKAGIQYAEALGSFIDASGYRVPACAGTTFA